MKFAIIAAADQKMGIGIKNKLPWRLKGDLKHFSDVTTDAALGKMNTVIMGRNTWLSLPKSSQPLKDRFNIVLSKEPMDLPEGVQMATSFEDAFEKVRQKGNVDKIFVIGGASIYAQAIQLPDCEKIYLTEVLGEFECDTFFPEIPDEFKRKNISDERDENGVRYRFVEYYKYYV